MKFLITGGSGYLGMHLAEALEADGHTVRLFMRSKPKHRYLEPLKAEHFYGDILSAEDLHKAMQGIDVVFHTAGVISYNPAKTELMINTNVTGTRNVCAAALKAGVKRLVFTSSSAAIGINQDKSKTMNEDTEFNARPMQMAYFDTKYDAEAEVKKAVEQGLDAVIVNPSSMIGARDTRRYENTYAGLIYRVNPPVLFHGGNNFVDIKDVTKGHLLAWQKGRTGERYILGGENVSFAELVHKTNRIIGRKSPRIYVPVSLMSLVALILRVLLFFGIDLHLTPQLVTKICRWYLYLDTSKAERELGYKPHSIDGAIKETLDWLKAEGRI